ncbi:MAG: hypothetical protein JWR01_817 [Subtercola sp.]|nr:hypothetical protein [Subtercola sp.]
MPLAESVTIMETLDRIREKDIYSALVPMRSLHA